MNYYDEQLKQLQMQVASKKRLESVLGICINSRRT